MYLRYRNIDFDYNEINVNEDEVKNYFDKIIDIAEDVADHIFEINIEDNFYDSFIYIEKKNNPNEWDKKTIDFVEKLLDNGYNVLYADEDYGENLDVIIIYNDE